MRTFGLCRTCISLVSYGALLVQFSPWAVAVLLLAGLPAFVAEAKFSGDAFRLFRWRSPETRMQMYLETVLAREDHAKEVKLFGLGPLLLERYRAIFRQAVRGGPRADDPPRHLGLRPRPDRHGRVLRRLRVDRAQRPCAAAITLGQMTMYLMLFRQGQSAVSASLSAIGGMYEDNLYLSTLYEYLETPVDGARAAPRRRGTDPSDGIRFEDVSFTYPGATRAGAAATSTLHICARAQARARRRERLGQDHADQAADAAVRADLGPHPARRPRPREWDAGRAAPRIGVIFQDFARYQLLVGENIGAGDVAHFEDEARWREAARAGHGAPIHRRRCPRATTRSSASGSRTAASCPAASGRRSRWRAPSCAKRPTSSCSTSRPRRWTPRPRHRSSSTSASSPRDRIAILISHRFSTVRMADQIVVIHDGRIIERGSHDELMQLDGHYAHLFTLQARGYR